MAMPGGRCRTASVAPSPGLRRSSLGDFPRSPADNSPARVKNSAGRFAKAPDRCAAFVRQDSCFSQVADEPVLSLHRGTHAACGASVSHGVVAPRVRRLPPRTAEEDAWRPGRNVMSVSDSHRVEGHVSRGFEAVREAFADNFARRRELGGACCAYRRGEKVVDLWGGVRNKQTGEPWEHDTMVIVYSATKGLAAMTLAIAHSRGWLDYEERVCTVLAGVRAAGQRTHHRPPAPRTPGGAVRARRARRSQPRR